LDFVAHELLEDTVAVVAVVVAAVERSTVDTVVDMPVVAARRVVAGLLLVVAVDVVVAAAEMVVGKLEFAAVPLLVRRNRLLLRKLAAGQELALPEKVLVYALLASAVEPEEGRKPPVVGLEGPKKRMLVKTLGVDHEESFAIYRRQGKVMAQ